jgi:CRP-like cAMP-binding protein
LEDKLEGSLRSIDFIYNSPGVNRPLRPKDDDETRENQVFYRNQINKVANAVKSLIKGIKESYSENPITMISVKDKAEPENIEVGKISSGQISFRVKIIQQVEIFSKLKSDLLEEIASKIEVFNLDSGHRLIEKGEQGSAMYIIVDGKAKVHDEDHLFSYLSGGDCFGEYTLIDEKQRSASVTIMEKTTLFRLSIDIFQELIVKNSVFVQGVLKVLVDRLRNLDKVQTQLSISNQQLKEQSQKIAEKNQELKYFNLTRTRVLSIVAEDLNSPIQEILDIIDNNRLALADEPGSIDSIDAIKTRLEKMEDIIKQLLNLKDWGANPD